MEDYISLADSVRDAQKMFALEMDVFGTKAVMDRDGSDGALLHLYAVDYYAACGAAEVRAMHREQYFTLFAIHLAQVTFQFLFVSHEQLVADHKKKLARFDAKFTAAPKKATPGKIVTAEEEEEGEQTKKKNKKKKRKKKKEEEEEEEEEEGEGQYRNDDSGAQAGIVVSRVASGVQANIGGPSRLAAAETDEAAMGVGARTSTRQKKARWMEK